MNHNLLTATLVAAVAIAGCTKKDHTIVGNDSTAASTPAVAPIDATSLPPSIEASKSYRCKDNSLVYIDWLSDKMTANVRAGKTDTPVHLKTAEVGKPLTAEGYSLTGDAAASSVTLTRPGKSSQSCEA